MPANQLLLDQIRRILEGPESGALLLGRHPEIIKVFCRQGQIEAVSSNLEQHRLGQYMVKEGFIEPSAIHPLVAESLRRTTPIGEIALRNQALDSPELSEVIRLQAIHLLRYAVEKQFALQSFVASEKPFLVPAGIVFEHLLLELARSDSTPFQIHPWRLVILNNGRDLSHLPWFPQELSVLSELKHPRTLQGLSEATGLEYLRLTKILSVFEKLRLVNIVDKDTAEETTKETTAIVKASAVPFEHLIPEITNAAITEKLEVVKNESSFVSEQFKSLKVRINEAYSENQIKTITITSPNAGDGKSLVAVNLAFCFAKDPARKVLLVEGDLRKPSLDQYLGISLEPGLIGYLENDHLQPHCYMRRVKNLYLLTAGGVSAKPLELLSLEKMRQLIEYLKTEFDTIIVDAPPLSPISDARILMGLSDAVVLVARRGKTPYVGIERAFEVIDRKKLLGVVLNDVKPMLFHTHHDSGYYRYGRKGIYPYASTRKRRTRPKTYLET
jgi:capsular exopolysaccharide synthesis family protein